ncbi:hypothetical protein B0H12DRAFT_1005161, partial [Mycena haematopus]
MPSGRLARSVRGTERARQRTRADDDADEASLPPHYRSPFPPASLPLPASKRIPRPPNAFILYRSDLLKKQKIPDHVERRQQNLSRIAGQCWNLLPPDEKRMWQDRAAKQAELHLIEHPDYRF